MTSPLVLGVDAIVDTAGVCSTIPGYRLTVKLRGLRSAGPRNRNISGCPAILFLHDCGHGMLEGMRLDKAVRPFDPPPPS
jgi:hypothetical protein